MAYSRSASAFAGYLYPLLEKYDPVSPVGKVIGDWCWDNEAVFGLNLATNLARKTNKGVKKYRRRHNKALSQDAWDKLKTMIGDCAKQNSPHLLIEHATILGQLLGLGDIEMRLFSFICLTSGEYPMRRLLGNILHTRNLQTSALLAEMLHLDEMDVIQCLSIGLPTQLSLIDGIDERPGEYDLYIPYRIMKAIRTPLCKVADFERALLGTEATPHLEMSDYDHISRERNFASALLQGAVASREHGVNILLYGAPGVGKTELAKVIAKEAGAAIFIVGEADEDGDEPDREERLSALQLAKRLAHRAGNSVLLFDEMEDVLGGGDTYWSGSSSMRRSGSKLHFNRMLETNETPVIWTANNLDEFDPAFLRRMRFAIEMKTPPQSVRRQQWQHLATREFVQLSDETVTQLAQTHKLPPSFAHSALKAVKQAGSDEQDLGFVITAMSQTCYPERRVAAAQNVSDFDMKLINPDCNLKSIKWKLRGKDAPRDVSFCLHGPPGTGKSAFASHLAATMELDALEKRASDLLSPWVGETEQNIAHAFEEAADDTKMLVIDEAESLFWNRDGAAKSWEASMVNEFLIGLERSPVPVACTTNHLQQMDLAALRRFTFKVKLDYLSSVQIAHAFNRFFGRQVSDDLRCNTQLTPGDFAVVKNQLRFCSDRDISENEIARMLEAEATVKQRGTGRIGF